MARISPLYGMTQDLSTDEDVASFLAPHGIQYQRWPIPNEADHLASQETLSTEEKKTLVECFRAQLDDLEKASGYTTADIVALSPNTPGLSDALGNFDREHYHTDDEVRFIVDGVGVFGFETKAGRKFTITVEAGDYIVIPAYAWHWFYMVEGRGIKALRIFKDTNGWTPHYKPSSPVEVAEGI